MEGVLICFSPHPFTVLETFYQSNAVITGRDQSLQSTSRSKSIRTAEFGSFLEQTHLIRVPQYIMRENASFVVGRISGRRRRRSVACTIK